MLPSYSKIIDCCPLLHCWHLLLWHWVLPVCCQCSSPAEWSRWLGGSLSSVNTSQARSEGALINTLSDMMKQHSTITYDTDTDIRHLSDISEWVNVLQSFIRDQGIKVNMSQWRFFVTRPHKVWNLCFYINLFTCISLNCGERGVAKQKFSRCCQ